VTKLLPISANLAGAISDMLTLAGLFLLLLPQGDLGPLAFAGLISPQDDLGPAGLRRTIFAQVNLAKPIGWIQQFCLCKSNQDFLILEIRSK
jgi:hypothetical protein